VNFFDFYDKKKIVGTLILKLVMVKRLYPKYTPVQRTSRNFKEPQGTGKWTASLINGYFAIFFVHILIINKEEIKIRSNFNV
jgi:hypothetical protein